MARGLKGIKKPHPLGSVPTRSGVAPLTVVAATDSAAASGTGVKISELPAADAATIEQVVDYANINLPPLPLVPPEDPVPPNPVAGTFLYTDAADHHNLKLVNPALSAPLIISSYHKPQSYAAVGMDPAAADNSAALFAAMQNRYRIDGGGERFRFTSLVPQVDYSYGTTTYGDVGLYNMKLDFSAAPAGSCMFLRGAQSGTVGTTGNVPIGRLTAYTQTAPVTDTSIFYPGAYVAIQSADLFYPGGTGVNRSEWNQVESVAAGVVTFRAPFKTQYTTNPSLYVLDNRTRPVFENVEIFGNAAVNQKGIELGFMARPTWDMIVTHDTNTTGLSLALCTQMAGGSMTGNNCVLAGNGYSMTIIGCQWGTIDAVQGIKNHSVLAIGATGGIISRDIVVANIVGDGILSSCANTHPGTADCTFQSITGSSRSTTPGGIGDFAVLLGVNHTIGLVDCQGADRNGVLLAYNGQKDIGRPTGYRAGFIRCANVQQFGLQITSASTDPTSMLDYVHVGGADLTSGRGLGIYADTSCLGDVYIGPSRSVQTSGAGAGYNEGAYHVRKDNAAVTLGTVTLDQPNAVVTSDYDQHAYWFLDTSANASGKVILHSPSSQYGVNAVQSEGMSLGIEGEPRFTGYSNARVLTFNNRSGKVNVQAATQQTGYRVGKWYRALESQAEDVAVGQKDRLYMQPLRLRTPAKITALGINVGASIGSAAQCVLAIYSNDFNGATAYAKLSETAAISITTPNTSASASLPAVLDLPAGMYWVGSVFGWTTAPSCWCIKTAAISALTDQFGSDTALQAGVSAQFVHKSAVQTFGAPLPDNFNSSPFALVNRTNAPPIVVAGGTGYVVGDLLTLAGGTSTTASVLRVASVTAGAVATVTIQTAGSYTVTPVNPVAQSAPPASGGTGATFNVLWVGTAVPGNSTQSAPAVVWQAA